MVKAAEDSLVLAELETAGVLVFVLLCILLFRALKQAVGHVATHDTGAGDLQEGGYVAVHDA
jgi:hypothetical protein